MSRLAEGLSRFFGRVEILARGAEDDRRAAERALALGHVLEARAHARALLGRVPGSPLALALVADAAEACLLDEEVVDALSMLAEQVPWRADVWLRLGLAALRLGDERALVALERAAAASDPAAARAALMALADADIARGEMARAERWLDRVPHHPSQADPELALRRAECLLARGRPDLAAAWAERAAGVDDRAGRLRLVLAHVARTWPERALGADAISLGLGAFLLGAPGAETLLAELVSQSADAALVERVRAVVSALARLDAPEWRASFALAEGRRADARRALLEAALAGNRGAARALAGHAERWRDLDTLEELARYDVGMLSPAHAELVASHRATREGRDSEGLSLACAALSTAAGAWATDEIARLLSAWVPEDPERAARWELVLGALMKTAKVLDRVDAISHIEALAVERERPLYVAVLGEFNAGKSTLLNALLGTDVAPTGIRPTTANLHWVAWAPDPFARIVVRGGRDRVVQHSELKRTLDELYGDGAHVERVYIYAPIERLKHVELLDTPGFNAPDTHHGPTAQQGVEEAHVALWLLDATAPLKESERRVIEQIGRTGVPIQILVNKKDRLSSEELASVMQYVTQALEEVGIRSLRPPVAVSAGRALAGRLGDRAALEESGWEAVEALLSEHIVDRCDVLRERALRRKAHSVAAELLVGARARADEAELQRRRSEELGQAHGELAARLTRDRRMLAETIAAELERPMAELAADALPLAVLPQDKRADAEVRSYLIERTRERLGLPLAEAIARRHTASGATEALDMLRAPVIATISGAAAVLEGQPYLAGAKLIAAVEEVLWHASTALGALSASSAHARATSPELTVLTVLTRLLERREPQPRSGGSEHGQQEESPRE